jgi:hypothetical protein
MARNYLIFLFGLVLLLAGILAIVGFVFALVISLVIGIASREEGGSLYLWFFGVAIITAIIFVWYLSRAGTLLQIW